MRSVRPVARLPAPPMTDDSRRPSGPSPHDAVVIHAILRLWESLELRQEPAGLSFRALSVLERSGPVPAAALAGPLGVPNTSLSRLGVQLVQAGLVTRTPPPQDGRGRVLALTGAARARLADLTAERAAALTAHLPPARTDAGPVLAGFGVLRTALPRLLEDRRAGG